MHTEEQNEYQNRDQEASHGPRPDSMELRQQVANDLKSKLDEFEDHKKGLKVLAALMGIHEKTLKRLLECENRPGYQTLFKIYRVIYRTTNDTKLIETVPPIIREVLLKGNPKGMDLNVNYTLDVERELRQDPIFSEIYFLCGTGGCTREYISFQYGRYGEETLNKMIEQEVVAPINKNTFVLGNNQANFSPETIKQTGMRLIDRFHKPENSDQPGENYQSLYASGLTEEAYNEWLKIDEKAFRDKVKIASNPKSKGDIKAFTMTTIDTLRPTKKETRH